ncbi:sensor histidine kinase [Ornithinimicrobium sufpigmenti]|uniref:sensor histidine kinase n=1 Tax=Ornithinimicrobium sufpigmenti TaxID=2508882 RepID=UPI00103682BF|nr:MULTISPECIES: HAMP domain-containing sensor histidine kinase [unclassified Ornithinimicrobium]
MRAILREHTVRVTLTVGGVVTGAGTVVMWALREAQNARMDAGADDAMPLWVALPIFLLVCGAALAVAASMVRPLADRTSERIAAPLRLLAHRTDEMASGGFALDPKARPGRFVEPEPLRSGIPEVDAVAREIDRHHSTFAKALVFERSFAADASHQLRTPLAALLLRLEEIAQCDDPVAREEAEIAIRQVERLTGVVDELLRRTRPGHASGGALSAVDMVLSSLAQEWTPAFDEAGREISLTCERGIIVEASSPAISQILNTLVENALIHGAGRVRVHVGRSGPSAVFTVADQGAGVPRELARVIFDRGQTSGEGTGLGLSVARATAEAVGGRLELTTVRPPVFTCYLPLSMTR